MATRSRRKPAKAPAKDEFDSDESENFDDDDSEEEEDSDFEDPDLIEVPGGGTSLRTIQTLTKPGGSGTARPSTSGISRPKIVNLTGDVIRTGKPVVGTSLLKANAAASKPALGSQNNMAYSSGDDDLEIIEVKPAPASMLNKNKIMQRNPAIGGQNLSQAQMQALAAARQKLALMTGAGGSGNNRVMSNAMLNSMMNLSGANLLGNPLSGSKSLGFGLGDFGLHAAAAGLLGGTSTAGQLDILQKSMQNGGLSRMLGGQNNPYSLWSGGGVTGTGPLQMAGMANAAKLDPYAPINSKQLQDLWAMGRINTNQMPGNNFQGGNMNFAGMFGPGKQELEDDEVAADDEEDMGVIETYSNYWPTKLKIGKPHPDPVVETASMASVEPPDVWYKLHLPEATIEEGKLSALQLEAITYACQQHNHILPSGDRAGFLIGDGAGVGKGRTIAGLILENFLQGRKKAIWVSVSNDLKYDSERDLKDIGAKGIDVHFLSKMKYGKINSPLNGNVNKGVMYATYSALIGESQNGGKYKTRLKQLVSWCGDDFDGCIVFDECHRAKNLFPGSGGGNGGKPTKTGQTVLELQTQLPKARIVYASATGASEPKHMAYMVRLGIWGMGSPFKTFQEFLGAVEKRGVGAMEIVAMDMKLRGIYIARQLSFQGVGFRIDEVELSEKMRKVYDESVKFWVDLMHRFEESAELINADKKMKKTMWGQFWSSHQRFFKYLCIASKVPHVIKVASEVMKMGKCVVIGLQSTGEARTMEAIEREEELTDFVSTAKGVLQSLIEKHFPAPDRNRIQQMLARQGLAEPKTILDELGINVPSTNGNGSSKELGKRKAKRQAVQRFKKKVKVSDDDDDSDSSNDDHGSDFEISNGEDEDEEEAETDEDANSDEDDFNPFGSGSESDEDDPWARKRGAGNGNKKKSAGKGKAKGKGKEVKVDPYAELIKNYVKTSKDEKKAAPVKAEPSVPTFQSQQNSYGPSKASVDRACQMKDEMMKRLEKLAQSLPANTLDQLIDELGGPENVSEMTGRKGRVVQDENGDVRYESRSEQDIPLETLNLTEKDRFMRGEKDVAIISEAASSGISLQADRRVKNQKRRVHMTLELPWSADRAIQQFGRTHRSNQVSAPEYILLISDLAGEHRFASIVAKRLESLGALTHGDRRATGERDLSRFNIDNKYGRAALESTFKAIMGYETPVVKPPTDYQGDFFKDIADGLVGVGLITQSEDMPGILTLDKGYNDMSKFLNRILGLPVKLQNMLFKYFSDTLAAIITAAKRSGRYDQGILDVGLTDEDHVELVRTHTYIKKHPTGCAKIELHVLQVERGLSWEQAKEKWAELVSTDEGFYISHQVRNGKRTAILAILYDKTKKESDKNKKAVKVFVVYRPNTGQQVKHESMVELKKKYKKVSPDEAEPHWNSQFEVSTKTCSHAYWRGNCKNVTLGLGCEIGLRKKTYNVLAGSVLTVWTQLEAVLTHDGNKKGTATRMQVVRLKLENDKRIVGTLIPNSALNATLKCLQQGSEEAEETIY